MRLQGVKQIENYHLVAPQVEQANLPLNLTISGGTALAVTWCAVKWLSGQLLEQWRQQLKDIKTSTERLEQDLRKSNEKLGADITTLIAREADLRTEISRLKCDISSEYVTREDWIRSTVGLENKLERMSARIDDKFDRLIERLPVQTWERN
jgi:DNA anti-recombination protein RmuC